MKKTKQKKNILLPLAAVLCLLSVAAMVIALIRPAEPQKGAFVPPAFDAAAIEGVPTVPEELAWLEVSQEGMSFSAHVCAEVIIENNSADLYFTSAAENEVWLKLRVLDSEGNILGETGLIKPGEYVQSVSFETQPKDGETIRLKLMGYEPKTYYSMGAVVLNTTVKMGG